MLKNKKIFISIIILFLLLILIILPNGIISYKNDQDYYFDEELIKESDFIDLQIFTYNELPFEADVIIDGGSVHKTASVNYSFYVTDNFINDNNNPYNGLYEIDINWFFYEKVIKNYEYAYMKILLMEKGKYVGYAVFKFYKIDEESSKEKTFCLELLDARKYYRFSIINSNVNYNFLINKCNKIIEKNKLEMKNND